MKPPSLVNKTPDQLIELSRKLRTGPLSVRNYLNRLERLFDEREPWIKAFVPESPDRFERLRGELAVLESRFPDPFTRPALYGILVGVKDIFHVDGLLTRAGSRIPPGVLKGNEAKVVTDLKRAGALILGKTVTTEFAYFAPGPTRNPHNIDHTPGGSSSGSAAAFAAGLCPLAFGTQTGGSLLRPASFCGVVGYKPSYARISTEGVIPLTPSLDHVGFLTPDIQGAIFVASILCKDWTQAAGEERPRLGTPEGPYLQSTSAEGLSHFRQTCGLLFDAGFEITPVEMFSDFDEIVARHKKLVAAEAAIAHSKWFHAYSALYHEKTANLIREGQAIGVDDLKVQRAGPEHLRRDLLHTMSLNRLSAIISPAAVGPAPKGLDDTGDQVMNLPWTHAGLPAVSLPSGVSKEGLPMGLQVVGPWMADELLLELARQIVNVLEAR